MKKEGNAVIDTHIRQEFFDAVSRIFYGKVVLKIHDDKVVQIKKREKKWL